jgi:hypothetical protein
MKVRELFLLESDLTVNFLAKEEGYKRLATTKVSAGKEHEVVLFTKAQKVNDDLTLDYEYVVNPGTKAWSFQVATEDIPAKQFADGEDESSMIKHMRKKHKMTMRSIEKWFIKEE